MARLLIDGEWYESVSSSAYWEAEFELMILERAPILYPEYVMVPFKVPVQSQTAIAKPDFALIERRYRRWWVVEVELAHHSLSAHVLPQVETLATARYGEPEAEFLSRQERSLDLTAMRDMMKGAQPRVLVIVNGPRLEWAGPLAKHDAVLMVAEVFRSNRNHHVLRVNGTYPSPPDDIISTCRLDPLLLSWVVVDSPANLDCPPNTRVSIEFEGASSEWVRVESKDRVWLTPVKANPLVSNITYVLVRVEGGRLTFRAQGR